MPDVRCPMSSVQGMAMTMRMMMMKGRDERREGQSMEAPDDG